MNINVYIDNKDAKLNVTEEIKKRSCGNPPVDINKINKEALTRINPLNYSDMKALECFFEAMLNLSKVDRETLHVFSNKKIKELYSYDRIIGEGAYGAVGLTTFLQKYKMVIKTIIEENPRARDIEDFLKEYLMGVAVINKFRLYCPNFCYTIGTFYCDNSLFREKKEDKREICGFDDERKNQYICYEEIKGKSLWDLVNEDKTIDFEFIFNIVVQILLALEIAQRKNNFCHYDLHLNNIIIQDKKSNFEVVLDDKKYSFTNTNIASIIDFSICNMTYQDEVLYTAVTKEIDSKRPYPVQGFDSYYFLSNLEYLFKIVVKRKDVSKFFVDVKEAVYKKDPYSGPRIKQGDNQYFARIFHFNEIISVSPLIILEYILQNYKSYFAESKIQISERDILYPLSPRSIFEVYEDLSGVKVSPDTECKRNIPPSLLLITYFNFDTPLKQEYIENDKKIYIGGYKTLRDKLKPIPSCDPVYKLNLKDRNLLKNDIVKAYLDATDVFDEIEKYVNIIYLVRQTGTIRIYNEVINEFINSDVYKHYQRYNIGVRNCRRWIKNLYNSLKV